MNPETAGSRLGSQARWGISPGVFAPPLIGEMGLEALDGFERVRLPRGALVPDHSDAEALYVIIDGVLILQTLISDGRRQVLGFRYPSDSLCSAYNRHLPSTTAYAATDAALWRVPHGVLQDLASRQARLAQALISSAVTQMERFLVHNLVLGRLRVEERLITFLLEIALRAGRRVGNHVVLELPMTREDIADYLGLSSETVSRGFSKLRRTGIARFPRPAEVHIRSLEDLSSRTVLASALIDRFDRGSNLSGAAPASGQPAAGAASACPFHQA